MRLRISNLFRRDNDATFIYAAGDPLAEAARAGHRPVHPRQPGGEGADHARPHRQGTRHNAEGPWEVAAFSRGRLHKLAARRGSVPTASRCHL